MVIQSCHPYFKVNFLQLSVKVCQKLMSYFPLLRKICTRQGLRLTHAGFFCRNIFLMPLHCKVIKTIWSFFMLQAANIFLKLLGLLFLLFQFFSEDKTIGSFPWVQHTSEVILYKVPFLNFNLRSSKVCIERIQSLKFK